MPKCMSCGAEAIVDNAGQVIAWTISAQILMASNDFADCEHQARAVFSQT